MASSPQCPRRSCTCCTIIFLPTSVAELPILFSQDKYIAYTACTLWCQNLYVKCDFLVTLLQSNLFSFTSNQLPSAIHSLHQAKQIVLHLWTILHFCHSHSIEFAAMFVTDGSSDFSNINCLYDLAISQCNAIIF